MSELIGQHCNNEKDGSELMKISIKKEKHTTIIFEKQKRRNNNKNVLIGKQIEISVGHQDKCVRVGRLRAKDGQFPSINHLKCHAICFINS